jgi:hypothetical protein
MPEYRIRKLGRARDEGFTVTRRDGDAWVWLPVRFKSFTAADQWITTLQTEEERAALGIKPRTSERTE